ncbi:hypothetical protein AVEN_156089-1 [Araneus ventricosus]|uniref:Uncharacterized protein n=1 Tax=Araneus ventricosus TaxID=182803 RepID=A0A4Y2KGN9_ARAVE|nr:hypothetical protein AVEN_156089-1 [Araneus ventricosus]
MRGKGLLREPSLLLRSFDRRALSNDFEGFETIPLELVVNEIVSLTKIMGLEVDKNDIDALVKEHSQDLTNEELIESGLAFS